jgi:hypothetical protein
MTGRPGEPSKARPVASIVAAVLAGSDGALAAVARYSGGGSPAIPSRISSAATWAGVAATSPSPRSSSWG